MPRYDSSKGAYPPHFCLIAVLVYGRRPRPQYHDGRGYLLSGFDVVRVKHSYKLFYVSEDLSLLRRLSRSLMHLRMANLDQILTCATASPLQSSLLHKPQVKQLLTFDVHNLPVKHSYKVST